MKITQLANLMAIGLVLSFTAVGCKTHPVGVTKLPGSRNGGGPGDVGPGAPVGGDTAVVGAPGGGTDPSGGIPAGPGHPGWKEDTATLSSQTVHFDYDSSSLKSSEQSKVASVADYLKSNSGNALKVEGHCDERGTEEYNRSLGEKRAQALREELVRLGVDASRVDTISYGEDRPADPGHNEAAWGKNRRGEFIVLTPP